MGVFSNAMTGITGEAGQRQINEGYNAAEGYATQYGTKAAEGMQSFVDFGKEGMASLADLIKNPSSVTQTPQYQFQLSEGLAALQRQYGAQGKFFSGEGARSSVKFAEGLASTSYQQQFQNLFNTAQFGEQAAQQQGQFYTNLGDSLATLRASKGRDSANMYFTEALTQKQHMHEAGMEAMQMTGSMM